MKFDDVYPKIWLNWEEKRYFVVLAFFVLDAICPVDEAFLELVISKINSSWISSCPMMN